MKKEYIITSRDGIGPLKALKSDAQNFLSASNHYDPKDFDLDRNGKGTLTIKNVKESTIYKLVEKHRRCKIKEL